MDREIDRKAEVQFNRALNAIRRRATRPDAVPGPAVPPPAAATAAGSEGTGPDPSASLVQSAAAAAAAARAGDSRDGGGATGRVTGGPACGLTGGLNGGQTARRIDRQPKEESAAAADSLGRALQTYAASLGLSDTEMRVMDWHLANLEYEPHRPLTPPPSNPLCSPHPPTKFSPPLQIPPPPHGRDQNPPPSNP